MKQDNKRLLWASVIGFFLAALSFVLMPLEGLGIFPGVLFWCGLLIGTVLQIVLSIRCKSVLKALQSARKEAKKMRIGLLNFGANRLARIADNVFVCVLLGTILSFILTKGFGYLCYIFIAITVFSFSMHCILNGRNYYCITNQSKIRRALEQKKANTNDKGEGEK